VVNFFVTIDVTDGDNVSMAANIVRSFLSASAAARVSVLFVYVCMYVCMYACMYVCMYLPALFALFCLRRLRPVSLWYVCMYVCSMHVCVVLMCE
jgi:hypothetical protein